MKVSIRDLSKMTGFSPATISNALNHKKGVNKDTAEEIFRIARETGYLSANAVTKIRLVIFKKNGRIIEDTPFFQSLIEGFEEECRRLGYEMVVSRADQRKKELHLLMIDLWKLKQVNKLYGVTTGDELLIQIAEYLHKINEANHVFRIHGNRFFVFTTSLMDYETNKDAIMKLFKRPFKVKGERISFSAAICGIINVQEVKEIDVLIDYLEYLVQLKPKSDRTILIQNDQHTKEGFLYEQEVKKYMATAIEEDLF